MPSEAAWRASGTGRSRWRPTSSGVSISAAGGSVLGTSPGMVAGAFQPKRSAASTSAWAPTLTPSGANTELHECANEFRKVPPQNSPFAFSSSTPSMIAWRLHGELRRGLHEPALERGGGGHDLERRPGRLRGREGDARRGRGSRRYAGRGRRRRRAGPRAPTTAASWRRVSIVVRIAWSPGAAWRAPARARPPRARRPGARAAAPRRPPRAPTARPASRAGSRARRAPGAPPPSPRAPCGPAIESAIPTSGEVRDGAWPSARTLPSCERSVARTGGALMRESRSPARSSGNTSRGAQSTRSSETGHAQVAAQAAEHARLEHHRDVTSLAVRSLGVVRLESGHRRGGGRAAVRAPEALERVARARLVAQQVVHGAEVAALPGGDEVGGRALRAGLSACEPDHRAGHERHGREAAERREERDG